MLTYPEIDPVAIALGPIKVHWYGLMYVAAFAMAWWLAVGRSKRKDTPYSADQVEDLIFFGAIGVVLGGRFGYVFFYGFERFLSDPVWLFKVWEGGMSFHGGLLGVMLAMYVFGRRHKRDMITTLDFVAPIVPLGLGFGRVGNFIGGELYGRVSDVPWAMVFPGGGPDPRHPSQLYQAGLEGLMLFIVVFWFSAKPRPKYAVSGVFAIGYGAQRFFVEFFRQPDTHIGFDAFEWLTRGQVLSLPLIGVGVLFLYFAYRSTSEQSPKR